ncbi:FkbM family methyltransferase [Brevundimonas variabilis]|uniref:FkbM family methyltransferase n=1 Tax=Brevundimonas variabilis TaxID=74312 RepID=A0A7W9CJF4_9CAUL|nr:FkbM family methyltransferase [Brevundimonas variabilis]MBB5746297.1 FkbM family methyltransferase [Brevundimonas variabilis]
MNIVGSIRRRLSSPYPEGMSWREFRRIRAVAPFQAGSATFLGRKILFSDSPGFLHSVTEVFADEVYRFEATTDRPHIIDAGANIGLSVLYFKTIYPLSTIVAFEPDEDIYRMLEQNVGHLPGVTLKKEAAWVEDTELTFFSEGSLAGSAEMDFLGTGKRTVVRASRLKDEIRKKPVDFLKIDIEGAENAVMLDIKDELKTVDHLFFEYHSNPEKPQLLGELLTIVSAAGFRYVINGTHGPRLPFVETVSHGFDLQLNVFCRRS